MYNSINAQNSSKELFDNSFLHQITFKSSSIPDSKLWDSLTDEYTMVNMIIDGIQVDSVGIRHKGFTSKASPQKPLKIDINKYVKGKKYDGLKKFNLHNNFQDDYLQREKLAYELYRRAGLPSPKVSYAEVYFGDTFIGLYSIVEQIDNTFLNKNFASDKGSLIKAEPPGFVPGIMLEAKEGTMDEFNEFRNNANASNFSNYVHLRNFLKQLAVDIIIEDWDSYSYNRHNFYVYYEQKTGLLNFINYDHNYAFAVDDPNNILYPIGTFPLPESIINDPSMKQMYEHTLCELLTYLIDSDFIEQETSNNYKIINSSSHNVKVSDPSSLNQYIAKRKEWLQDTLTRLNIDCNGLSYKLNENDLVINEFVAWSDNTGGIEEPNGGTPDWIELYNNSDNDIVLNENYYISDDEDFPKKWYFPKDTLIPSKGYLTIWADKDVHQEGLHAGFKIDKDGGRLVFTYEDMSNIQHISYEQQSLNMGYARVPNGTGNFTIQQATFNSNNEMLTEIEKLKNFGIKTYPNPANDNVWIETEQQITSLTITNSLGKVVFQIDSPSFPLHIDKLGTGFYFLTLTAGADEFYQKLIVR